MVACASRPDAAPSTAPDADRADPEVGAGSQAAAPGAEEPEPAAKPEPAKPEATKPAADVLAVIAGLDEAKIFNELLGLSDVARGMHSTEGAGFTLLVPTDAAFARLPKGTVDRLKKNTAELERLIKAHMVLGSNDTARLANFRTAPTAEGKEVEVKVQDVDMIVGGAKLIETDLKASNGYVHVIDKVLTLSKK